MQSVRFVLLNASSGGRTSVVGRRHICATSASIASLAYIQRRKCLVQQPDPSSMRYTTRTTGGRITTVAGRATLTTWIEECRSVTDALLTIEGAQNVPTTLTAHCGCMTRWQSTPECDCQSHIRTVQLFFDSSVRRSDACPLDPDYAEDVREAVCRDRE